MASGVTTESVDLWDVLEEAELTVERWPAWQQRIQADIFYEEELVSWDIDDWWLSGVV